MGMCAFCVIFLVRFLGGVGMLNSNNTKRPSTFTALTLTIDTIDYVTRVGNNATRAADPGCTAH